MPDAAKLMAAAAMAVLAFIVTGLIIPLFEEETNFGYFTHVNVVLGAIVGWIVIGRRAGRGIVSAINVGITSSVVLVFWGLFIQSCNEMTRLALKNRYDDPFEAIIAIFQIGSEWAILMTTVLVWSTLLIGGIVVGLASEFAWRTWR